MGEAVADLLLPSAHNPCVCLPAMPACLPARDITRAISGRDLGYLTGAVVGGVIYDRWGRNLSQLMMAVAISMLATITVSEGNQPWHC